MIDGAMVALGISPEGRPVPIQLTAAGLLAVSGGSGGVGNGAFVGGYTLIGIAPDGTRVPIAVDSNGIVQTGSGSGDATAQAANTVQAGPTTGAAALPTYRALVGADLPATITKSSTFSANGALSAPALSVVGTVITGGSATTTKPLVLIEPTGTVSTGWSTAGTMLGVNAPSGFTGNLIDLQLTGTGVFKVGSTGIVTLRVDQNGPTGIGIINATNNTTAYSTVNVQLDASGIKYGSFEIIPAAFTSSGLRVASSVGLFSTGQTAGIRVYTGDSAALILGTNNTARVTIGATGGTTFVLDGAASLPALSLTGIPFAGTGTTSFPLLYLNNSGATASTTLSTSGTAFGINSHGTPDLINAMLDGVSKFVVTSAGLVQTGSAGSSTTPAIAINSTANGFYMPNASNISVVFSTATAQNFGTSGFAQYSSAYIGWSSSSSSAVAGTVDTQLNRLGPASLQLGAAASATPVANTFTVGESSRGGTDTNVAGASGTFASGRGTGTGAASSLIFQTPTVGSTGTTQQTLATRFTIATAGLTAAVPILLPSGTVGSLSLSWSSSPNDGIFISGGANMCFVSAGHLDFRNNGSAGGIVFSNGYGVGFESGAANGPDLFLYRDAPNVLALRNSTTAQEARIYGTTTGSKYLSLKHDGTNAIIDSTAGSIVINQIPKFGGTNTTGAGVAAIGANSPASTLTAPYTWIQIVTSDGSTAYIPAWK